MLTQSDLQKISSIMQSELQVALLNHPTKADLKEALKDYPTRDEMNITLDNVLSNALKGYVTKKEFKKESNTVQKKLNIIINFFDREYLALEERVQKIEYIVYK